MLEIFIPIYLLSTIGIGYWASTKIKTSGDFMLAGRNLSTAFVGVTIFATWFGSSHIMGIPGEFVERGFLSFFSLIVTGGLCLVIIGLFYARRLRQLNILTIADFFQIRYNSKVGLAVSVILIFTYPHWIAAQFVALGLLFQNVLAIPMEYGIILGASIVILYTYIGGMWAVSYTDMVQSILILIGLFVLLANVLGEIEGIEALFADKPASFFNIFPEGGFEDWSDYATVVLAYLIGTIPAQEIYQRVFSARSERAAVNGVFLGALLLVCIPAIPMLIALAGAHLHPELMGIDSGQNIIPSMVSLHSGPIIQVLFYGALISAILSTSSGALLAPSTVIGENLLRPNIANLSDKQLLFYTRLSVIAVAIVSCYFAYTESNIVDLVVSSMSLLLVCVFAPFSFGLFWKRSSVVGAWSAIVVGGLTWFFCYMIETRIDSTVYGTVASCIGMVLGSIFRPDHNSTSFALESGQDGI